MWKQIDGMNRTSEEEVGVLTTATDARLCTDDSDTTL